MIRCLTGWALFFVLWLLFADSTQGYELLVGAGVAALAVAGTEAARIKQHVTGELHIRWLIPLVRIPIAVLRDCGVVLAAWIHEFPHGPRQGRFVWIPFTPPDHGPSAAAKRALAISAVSVSPNSIVIGIHRHRKFLLLHEAAARPKPDLIRKLEAA